MFCCNLKKQSKPLSGLLTERCRRGNSGLQRPGWRKQRGVVGLAGGDNSTAAISAKEKQEGREFGQENVSPREAEKEVFSEASGSASNMKMGHPCEGLLGSKSVAVGAVV